MAEGEAVPQNHCRTCLWRTEFGQVGSTDPESEATKAGEGTISCMAMTWCGKGWKRVYDCEPGMHCIDYGMCGSELLCAKCDPSEDCPRPF